MASIIKHTTDTYYVIKHNVRELPTSKAPSNLEIDTNRKHLNNSLVRRGTTAKEINMYRKKITKELFKYNRKNLVQSIEVCIQLPKDCPKEQESAFFRESYNYVVSTLPMGERCVFLAEVHADEGIVQKDGRTVVEGAKHLHVMYVPAVPDTKHDGFDYKLCANDLTKKACLKAFHPGLQKHLDDKGIKATVKSGITDGNNIPVSQLKSLSKETGLTLSQVKELQRENSKLISALIEAEKRILSLENALSHVKSVNAPSTWGSSTNWGQNPKSHEEEKTW